MSAEDNDRSAKRIRLQDIGLDTSHPTDSFPPGPSLISPTFHLPNESAGFNQQYHWPAQPASASTSGLESAGLSADVQEMHNAMQLPMPLGNLQFDEATLHSAVASGTAAAAASAAVDTPSTAAPPLIPMPDIIGGGAPYSAAVSGSGGSASGGVKRKQSSVAGDEGGEAEGDEGLGEDGQPKQTPFSRTPELKVHHKLAERQRRKEMKDLFEELREVLPAERVAKSSKWEILKRAIEYIQGLRQSEQNYAAEVERLRRDLEISQGGQLAAYEAGMEAQVDNGQAEGAAYPVEGAVDDGTGQEHQQDMSGVGQV